SGIPIVLAAHAGGVDHRHALVAAFIDQRADVRQRNPGILAAGIAPALDRFEDRLRTIAAESPIHVDHQQRRTFAEAAARAVAGSGEHRLVAFGEEFVPDGLGHCTLPSCYWAFTWRLDWPAGVVNAMPTWSR